MFFLERARLSCLVAVYSKKRMFGIKLVSRMSRSSEIFHETIRGKTNGVRITCTNVNQSTPKTVPIIDPTMT